MTKSVVIASFIWILVAQIALPTQSQAADKLQFVCTGANTSDTSDPAGSERPGALDSSVWVVDLQASTWCLTRSGGNEYSCDPKQIYGLTDELLILEKWNDKVDGKSRFRYMAISRVDLTYEDNWEVLQSDLDKEDRVVNRAGVCQMTSLKKKATQF